MLENLEEFLRTVLVDLHKRHNVRKLQSVEVKLRGVAMSVTDKKQL